MSECLSALKAGDINHSQTQYYHCKRKGHIKANSPEWKEAGAQPWKGRAKPWSEGYQDSNFSGRRRGETTPKNKFATKQTDKQRVEIQTLQSIQEDFQ